MPNRNHSVYAGMEDARMPQGVWVRRPGGPSAPRPCVCAMAHAARDRCIASAGVEEKRRKLWIESGG